MMFGRNRVEQDLARIKHANLPGRYPDPDAKKAGAKPGRSKAVNYGDRIEAKDILAMVIAVFSLILPYLLAFLLIIGGIVWMISYIW